MNCWNLKRQAGKKLSKFNQPLNNYAKHLHKIVFNMEIVSPVWKIRWILLTINLTLIMNLWKREIILKQKTRSESTRLNSSHVSISYAVFCLKIKIKCESWNTGLNCVSSRDVGVVICV